MVKASPTVHIVLLGSYGEDKYCTYCAARTIVTGPATVPAMVNLASTIGNSTYLQQGRVKQILVYI